MIKAVFFDIDGTLFSHRTNTVPESARCALRELQKRGIRIYMASGRGLDSRRILKIDDIPFDGYVTYNGQLCYDRNRRFLFGNPIPEKGREALLHLFAEKKFPVILIGKDRSVINMTNRRTQRVQKDFRLTVPPVGTFSEKDSIYQALVLATREEESAFSASLDGCRITRWFEEGVDVIPVNGSKIAGIRRIAAHDGIRPEEIMAFGDSENDVEMLRGAAIGIAMGNADSAARHAADYITTDVDDNGILDGLLHYGLLSA